MLIRKKVSAFSCLLVAGLLTAPPLTFAQDEGPAWLTFRIHTVKRDQTDAWEAIMKERREAEAAAGSPFLRVFEPTQIVGQFVRRGRRAATNLTVECCFAPPGRRRCSPS